MVVVIMALNLTVAVGTINGFIFYANIMDVYDEIFLPFTQTNFPEIIIEWLNLDPGIDVCFVPGYDVYHHSWVRLLFSLYLINARRACTRELQYSLCVCVCVCVTSLLPSFHIYASNMTHQPSFRQFFFVLNFVDFVKKPRLQRKSVLHSCLVVYSR